VADRPDGYREIPEDDRIKAQRFFDRGKTVADAGQFDYAIEMYLQGLFIDPDSVPAHQALREISLKRKVSGGKPLGMMDRAKTKTNSKDDKANMLAFEKLLAFDPGNTDYMLGIALSAQKSGFYDSVLWIGPILLKANEETKKPEVKKFLALKDIYKEIKQFRLAVEACDQAIKYAGDDMDLQTERKNLGALQTIDDSGYNTAKSFRDTMRDKDKQQQLMDSEKDVRSEDVLAQMIRQAEADYKATPADRAKVGKLVDLLLKTEAFESENRAIEVLEKAYADTKQFAFRQRIGRIKMDQMRRMERSLRDQLKENPKDEALKRDYDQFKNDQIEFELSEFQIASEAYPTELGLKFEVATRLFVLKRYDEAIPLYQQARSDPKIKIDSSIGLGRSFLEAGFADEAVDTFQTVIDDYQLKDDLRYKEMYYWQGRAFEAQGNRDQAIKRYSQVAQSEFTYRDVQQRIKGLRASK
jgi:tetratricopeptide (TPR) repeat protein